jgi:hypothetical protein
MRQVERDCVKRETRRTEALVIFQMLIESDAVVGTLLYCVAQSMGHEAG